MCTVKTLNRLLTKFFNYCVKSDLIVKSPLNAVEIPIDKTTKDKYKFLSRGDIDKFIKAVDEDINNFIFVFAIFTGLRQGEILALMVKDIDLKNDIVYVNKTVKSLPVEGKMRYVVSVPKTKSSIREIPILNNLKDMLVKYIDYIKDKHNQLQIPYTNNSILFLSPHGTYCNTSIVNSRLAKVLKHNSIQNITFHALRHTFARY